jgi:hypothetical protein
MKEEEDAELPLEVNGTDVLQQLVRLQRLKSTVAAKVHRVRQTVLNAARGLRLRTALSGHPAAGFGGRSIRKRGRRRRLEVLRRLVLAEVRPMRRPEIAGLTRKSVQPNESLKK